MPTQQEYKCTNCGQKCERDQLVTVQVRFYELGSNGKLLKTRTIGWLGKDCCLEKDGIWQAPKHVLAPGISVEVRRG